MGFDVTPEAYARFMGVYSEPLSQELLRVVDPRPGQRALDVGCGTGILTTALVDRLGADAVTAIDPSEPLLAAVGQRFPGLDARLGTAERLPFDDAVFDLTLAQLVVHFMTDPVQGLREMARVTRPGGSVAAAVWDHHGGGSPLAPFWEAVTGVDPEARDEATLPGTRQGELEELFRAAGLADPQPHTLTVTRRFETFEDWWAPYLLGVGPAGDYVARLDPPRLAVAREACRDRLPPAPFEVSGRAWCAYAVV